MIDNHLIFPAPRLSSPPTRERAFGHGQSSQPPPRYAGQSVRTDDFSNTRDAICFAGWEFPPTEARKETKVPLLRSREREANDSRLETKIDPQRRNGNHSSQPRDTEGTNGAQTNPNELHNNQKRSKTTPLAPGTPGYESTFLQDYSPNMKTATMKRAMMCLGRPRSSTLDHAVWSTFRRRLFVPFERSIYCPARVGPCCKVSLSTTTHALPLSLPTTTASSFPPLSLLFPLLSPRIWTPQRPKIDPTIVRIRQLA